MTEFNLRHLVRDVMASTTMADPSDIADEVSRRIGDADLRIALNQAMRGFVREEITRQRPRSIEDHVAPNAPQHLAAVPPTETHEPPVHRAIKAPQPPTRSAKVAGIRDWWSTELRKPYHVGEKRWLALGDCGFDDLMYAAAERRDHAQRNASRATALTQLAGAVAAAGVARVRDLPADTLRTHLGGVAA